MNDQSIEEICCLAAVRVGHVMLCYDSQVGRQADLCVLKAGRPTELIGLH